MKISRAKVLQHLAATDRNQKDLADMADMKRSQLSAILARESCTPKNVRRLADALQVSVSEIMEEG